MNKLIILLASVVLFSCSTEVAETIPGPQENNKLVIDTIPIVVDDLTLPLDSIFSCIDTNFRNKKLLLPEGFSAKILFTEKRDQVVVNDSVSASDS